MTSGLLPNQNPTILMILQSPLSEQYMAFQMNRLSLITQLDNLLLNGTYEYRRAVQEGSSNLNLIFSGPVRQVLYVA